MSVAAWVMLASAAIALGTLAMTARNLARYRPAPRDGSVGGGTAAGAPVVSVCIPARNEEANLRACVQSLLRGDEPAIEVLVYDDQSTDGTGAVLESLMERDARVRRITTAPLPPGWNGKQHACWRMAQAAAGRWMLFTDADVRFEADAVRRSVALAEALGVGLLSTFPRQRTGTLGEALLIPLIHFILLSYLPIGRMRSTTDPAASAGCGQFLLVTRGAYHASGGHAAFKDSMHDGIKMPRAVRRAGLRTDLFDGTDLASCRMYQGLAATWRGFAKNAFEGLGSVALLGFISVLHLAGHVMPWVYLLLALAGGVRWDAGAAALAGVAAGLALVQRLLLARRFEQSVVSAAMHPVGIAMMTVIQWHSFVLHRTGRRSWRGRTLEAGGAGPVGSGAQGGGGAAEVSTR